MSDSKTVWTIELKFLYEENLDYLGKMFRIIQLR